MQGWTQDQDAHDKGKKILLLRNYRGNFVNLEIQNANNDDN